MSENITEPPRRARALTPEETRLRDTTALALLSACSGLLRELPSADDSSFPEYVSWLVDRAYLVADEVMRRRER